MDTREPCSADTAFYMASSTKSMTALALATLHARGEIDLDRTLADYAPDAQFPATVRPGEVRLRHLLTHTHGIKNEALGFRVAFTGQHTPETLWRLLGASEVNTDAPFGQFEYTNVGYNVATVLTDRHVGVRWQELVQREIFAPARMTRASAVMSRAEGAGWSIAKPHSVGPDGSMQRIYLEKTDQTMHAAGGVIISANDAARWLELLIEDGRVGARQIIPAAAVQATRAPYAEVDANFNGYQREHYGLGWYLGPYREERMLHHFGGFAGFRAHVSYIPARRIGVAAFVNDSSVSFDVVDAIANYVYDRTGGYGDAQERLDAALDALVRDRDQNIARGEADRVNRASRQWMLTRPKPAYAGSYVNEDWGRIEIAADDEAIELRFGVLHGRAEPFTRPDSIRVELVPGMGVAALFVGDGPAPEAFVLRGQRFARV